MKVLEKHKVEENMDNTIEKVQTKTNPKKKIYLELLRIIAIILVLYNHTDLKGFWIFSVTENQILSNIYMFLACVTNINVPLFFMISGALLINKEESYKDLFIKRILKYIIIIFLFQFIAYCLHVRENFSEWFSLSYFLKEIYSSGIMASFWFLYSYLAILIVLPFIRKMAINMSNKDYRYLFLLYVLFIGIIPILEYVVFKDKYHLNLTLPIITVEGVFYFMMGYFLEHRLKKGSIKQELYIDSNCGKPFIDYYGSYND